MKTVAIKSIKKIGCNSKRYDIQIEDNENFFANGILVHNSCIQAWYDDVKNLWRVSTLGTITTMSFDQAFRPNETFADLFLKTAKKIDWNKFDKQYTYLFELCTHDNRIITQYPEDTIYLIAVREKRYGLYKTDQEVDDICLDLMEAGTNVKRPALKFLFELGLNSLPEVVEWVEQQAENPQYGTYPEGFIVYRGGIPVAKMKNKKYLAVFHVSGGNKGHAKNAIIEAIFVGNIDDVYAMMIPELQKFADEIKEKVAKLGKEVMESAGWIVKGKYPTQKDYALAVQTHCKNSQLHSFFFKNKEEILGGNNISEIYTVWIKECYKRFLDIWKCNEDPKDNRE